MNNFLTKLTTAAILSAAIATPGIAASPQIKARQALMQIYVFNISQLGAMAKGVVAYDSAAATAAANNLKAAAAMDQSAMWPQGTDNEAMFGETRALPTIWSTFPAVEEKGKALIDASAAMAAVAGADLPSLQGAMKALGGACGGCHKTFRQPED